MVHLGFLSDICSHNASLQKQWYSSKLPNYYVHVPESVHNFFKWMTPTSNFVGIARLVVLARKDPGTTSPFSSLLDPVSKTCILLSHEILSAKGLSSLLSACCHHIFVTVTQLGRVRVTISVIALFFLINILKFCFAHSVVSQKKKKNNCSVRNKHSPMRCPLH